MHLRRGHTSPAGALEVVPSVLGTGGMVLGSCLGWEEARPLKKLRPDSKAHDCVPSKHEDLRNNGTLGPSLSTSSSSPALLQHCPQQQGDEGRMHPSLILSLPDSVLHHIVSKLDSHSLTMLSQCCKLFFALDKSSGLRFTHKYAKEAVVRMVGPEQAVRWRLGCAAPWLHRLRIEEAATGFDRVRAEEQAFTFKEDPSTKVLTEIKLESPGPRILVSDVSTAQADLLRWKFVLRGNNAAEFGVIPVDLQDTQKALHKCLANDRNERGVGFHSAITVGSLLPARLPLMKGSVVEVLASANRVHFIVTNPEDGTEMTWQNNSTVSRPYKGPRELRLSMDYTFTGPIKLAVTAWHRAAFEVIHTQEQLRRSGVA